VIGAGLLTAVVSLSARGDLPLRFFVDSERYTNRLWKRWSRSRLMPLDLSGLRVFDDAARAIGTPFEVIELPENVSTTLGETVEFPRQPARPCSADSRRFNNLCFNEDLQLF